VIAALIGIGAVFALMGMVATVAFLLAVATAQERQRRRRRGHVIVSRKRELATARETRQEALDQAVRLSRRLMEIEREIGAELGEAPRCVHPKQPCAFPSCGRGQRRAALEWALAVVRRDGQASS
jgi:hypothetical protein